MRALIGIEAVHNGIIIKPAIPPGLERLRLKVPIRFGEKLIYLDLTHGGKIEGTIEGRDLLTVRDSIFLSEELLGKKESYVAITYK